MSYHHVDLCCGLSGWQAPFRESSEWRTVGLDVRRDVDPDVRGDVRDLPLRRCQPDLVTASPPCTEVTKYRLPWYPDDPPDLRTHDACRRAIEWLDPDWWVIENVQGLHDFWGPPDKKWGPWYLWGRFPPLDPGAVVCKQQNQTPHAGIENAVIPYRLADAFRHAVETWG